MEVIAIYIGMIIAAGLIVGFGLNFIWDLRRYK
jgi:hypothetical protein